MRGLLQVFEGRYVAGLGTSSMETSYDSMGLRLGLDKQLGFWPG